MNAGDWGVATGYRDAAGTWHDAPAETVRAVLETMGATDSGPPVSDAAVVLRAGQSHHLDGPAQLVTEDGASMRVDGVVPDDLPPGYYDLRSLEDGRHSTLIVSPGLCHLPRDLFTWGWTVQLYAARSDASWGMGDLGDLARIGRWADGQGAGLVLVNPLHAALPSTPQEPSPYFPSSRCFRNPLYIRVEDVPGAERLGADIERLAAEGRALNDDRRIDRDAVFLLKSEALGRIWHDFGGSGRFDAFMRRGGPTLRAYATFCALHEELAKPWPEWPHGYRHPDNAAVARFADEYDDRIRFHSWLQWLLDEQLAAASEGAPLVHDLAVGFDPAGADAWMWQDVVAQGMRVGAPPDEFNAAGQDWGLPPFDPWRLRQVGYRPFIETVRAAFAHAGGLRVDHVMGLFRLFWIPDGSGPSDGTYVRYPASDLLDIVALESHRAVSFVVGEDLGTVEAAVRDELARRSVLSYRVLWFEEDPARLPEQALAAVTTHDLPTVAAAWSGGDKPAMRHKLEAITGLGDDADSDAAVVAAYDALSRSPSMVVTATLEDALLVEERPNIPGVTSEERPNWSLALPTPFEEWEGDERPARIAHALRRDQPASA